MLLLSPFVKIPSYTGDKSFTVVEPSASKISVACTSASENSQTQGLLATTNCIMNTPIPSTSVACHESKVATNKSYFSPNSTSQYISTCDCKTLLQKNDNFIFLHLNIRSLQKNFNKLQHLLHELTIPPDIIALSETWTTETSFFKPNLTGYVYLCNTSLCNRAGGVAMFVKNDLNFTIRKDLNFSCNMCENLWVEFVSIKKNKKETFGVVL